MDELQCLPLLVMKMSKNAIILILVIFIGIINIPVGFLEISHNREGVVFHRKLINLNDRITIRYIHSVMKTPVLEHYLIMPDGRLLLTDTEFMSYGAGLPEKNDYEFEITDKGFRVYNINKPFDFIVYRTAPIHTGADVTLVTENVEVPFLSFSKERTPVRIAVRRVPGWIYISREVGKWLMNKSR